MALLSSFEDYRRDHQQHHAYVASPHDPDRRFIAFLGVSFQVGKRAESGG